MRINRSVVWSGLFCGMLMLASAQIEPRGENPAIRVNTLYGATGLITVPTSTTTRVERFQLGTAFGHDVHTVSLNWGVYEGIEIGGTVVDVVAPRIGSSPPAR
jgi:hypothetical protein